MKQIIYCSLLAGLMVAAPVTLFPSESYPPPTKSQVDSEKYALGQKIFTGKLKLPAANAKSAEAQLPKLKKLQEALPKTMQERTKLTLLAGKLDEKQLAALQYYVEKRFCKM